MLKKVVEVVNIEFTEADRHIVSGVKAGDNRPSQSGPDNFRRLKGGMGQYTTASQILVHIIEDHATEDRLDVANQFRAKYANGNGKGRLTPQRVYAILQSRPLQVEIEKDENGNTVQVSDISIEAWYQRAVMSTKNNKKK